MDRRYFLSRLIAGGLLLPAQTPMLANAANANKSYKMAGLRGALDATQFGVRPDAFDDQGKFLQKVLDRASKENKPVFLPPGRYEISNINLPQRTRLMGISGTSRLIYSGGGAMLSGTGAQLIELDGISLDGANRPIGDEFGGLLHLKSCPRIMIDRCDFIGSQAAGVSLENCGGRVERTMISGAAGIAGLFSVNASGLSIQNNVIENCSNGGLLVHRWSVGADNTIVIGNRIQKISAIDGGTGQRGNGINLFRANGLIVSNNHISDCSFSAIRANSSSNSQITGNTCLGSGETAIYSEFAFEGSIIANNIVDGGTMGISIANFNEGGRLAICANNLIRNMKTEGPYPAEIAGFGIGISVEADTSVTGNVIEGAPLYGINLGWGPYLRNVIAANNIVRNTGEGIVVSVVKGAGTATINGNIIEGSKNGAIIGHEWKTAVTGELALGKRNPFPHLTVHGNVVR